MVRALTIAPALLAVACSFGSEFGGTRYQCGADDRCPDGQTCVAGYCEAEPGSDGPGDPDASSPGPDAASPDAATVTPPCGSIGLLTDTFGGGGPGPQFFSWNDPGTSVVETGGQLLVSINAGSADAWAGYTTDHLWDLTNGALDARIGQVGGQHTVLEVRTYSGSAAAQLVAEGASFAVRVINGNTVATRRTVAYDPAQVYWRIRTASGTMSWETSANRTTWTVLHSEPTPFDVRHVRAILAAGGQLATASQARYDDLNPTVPAGLAHCPAAQLTDDFTSGGFAPAWQAYNDASCTITETGGKAVLAFPGTASSSWCGLLSLHLWSLVDSAVVIDSNELPNRGNFLSYFQVVSAANGESRVELSLDNGTLEAANRVAGVETTLATLTYSRTTHRYWRLRGVGDQIELATSPDQATWTTRATVRPDFALAPVRIGFGAGHYAAVSPSGTVTVGLPGLNAP